MLVIIKSKLFKFFYRIYAVNDIVFFGNDLIFVIIFVNEIDFPVKSAI